mmetsp:Transcript_52421/g.156431  ORF Transcript_52421/g.156431 Transcript_52421/m.156431 type:complete len:236 (+) Transcript_52421:34-741(+)
MALNLAPVTPPPGTSPPAGPQQPPCLSLAKLAFGFSGELDKAACFGAPRTSQLPVAAAALCFALATEVLRCRMRSSSFWFASNVRDLVRRSLLTSASSASNSRAASSRKAARVATSCARVSSVAVPRPSSSRSKHSARLIFSGRRCSRRARWKILAASFTLTTRLAPAGDAGRSRSTSSAESPLAWRRSFLSRTTRSWSRCCFTRAWEISTCSSHPSAEASLQLLAIAANSRARA